MGGYPAPTAVPQTARPAPVQSRENLALIYQEVLTAITRFRSNRQTATDAGVFRNQMKAAIRAAESAATASGYPVEDTRLATFAVVAFLTSRFSTRITLSSLIGLVCLCRRNCSVGIRLERYSFSASTAFWPVTIPFRLLTCWRSLPCASCWVTGAATASAVKRAYARFWRRSRIRYSAFAAEWAPCRRNGRSLRIEYRQRLMILGCGGWSLGRSGSSPWL